MKRRIIIDPPLEGYEEEVEIRPARSGEIFYCDKKDGGAKWTSYNSTPCSVPILKPKKKYLDWNKFDDDVLAFNKSNHLVWVGQEDNNDLESISNAWQPHLGSDLCPVDENACLVVVRLWKDHGDFINRPVKAGQVKWSAVAQWRFIELVDGYEYP